MFARRLAAAVVLLGGCVACKIAGLRRPEMTERLSGVAADLRAVAMVDARTAWASGSGGVWVRTQDAGQTWDSGVVPGAEALDFRSLAALAARRALVLSAGAPARMFLTADAGANWREVYRSDRAGIFFDALVFADPVRGYALADPVDGRFVLLETKDEGETWRELQGPEARAGEGAFAASNSCLAAVGEHVWFGTGGSAARVFHSSDRARTWSVADAPAPSGAASQGVFSIAFRDELHGALAGGDYRAPETAGAFATTDDGGATWTPGPAPPGYRSSVAFLSNAGVVVTGISGSDYTELQTSWDPIGSGYNAVALRGSAGWVVGPKGRIARLHARERGP